MDKTLSEKDIKAVAFSRWINDNRKPLYAFSFLGAIIGWASFLTLIIWLFIPTLIIAITMCWKFERYANKFYKEWNDEN